MKPKDLAYFKLRDSCISVDTAMHENQLYLTSMAAHKAMFFFCSFLKNQLKDKRKKAERRERMNLLFYVNSVALGVGLAMDAFSVSIANGLNEPFMKKRRMCLIAGVYAAFQFLMPMIGWFCVHTIAEIFVSFQKFIPWIALILLCYIGGKMLVEGIQKKKHSETQSKVEVKELGLGTLMVQGIATSIDALSVGFTIAEYSVVMALICSLIIAAVTFVICMGGLIFGKKFGTKLADRASIFGGLILIIIGIEIFVTGI